MERNGVDFELDCEGHWMAVFASHHTHHVRHQLPFVERPRLRTWQGRQQTLGVMFARVKCACMEMSDALTEYSATPWFNEKPVPTGLQDYSTKRGV